MKESLIKVILIILFSVLGLSSVQSKEKVSSQSVSDLKDNKNQSCDVHSIQEMEQAVIDIGAGRFGSESEILQKNFLSNCLEKKLNTYIPDIHILTLILLDNLQPSSFPILDKIKRKNLLATLSRLATRVDEHKKREIENLTTFFQYGINLKTNGFANVGVGKVGNMEVRDRKLLEQVIQENKKINNGVIKHVYILQAYLDLSSYYMYKENDFKKAADLLWDGVQHSDKNNQYGLGSYGRLGVLAAGVNSLITDKNSQLTDQKNDELISSAVSFIKNKNKKLLVTDSEKLDSYSFKALIEANKGNKDEAELFLQKFDKLKDENKLRFEHYVLKWGRSDFYFKAEIALGKVNKAFKYFKEYQLPIEKKYNSPKSSYYLKSIDLLTASFNKFSKDLFVKKHFGPLDGSSLQKYKSEFEIRREISDFFVQLIENHDEEIQQSLVGTGHAYEDVVVALYQRMMYVEQLANDFNRIKSLADICLEFSQAKKNTENISNCANTFSRLSCRFAKENDFKSSNIRRYVNLAINNVSGEKKSQRIKNINHVCKARLNELKRS